MTHLQQQFARYIAIAFLVIVSLLSAMTSGLFFGEYFAPTLTGLFSDDAAFVVAAIIGAIAVDGGAWAWFAALTQLSRNASQYTIAGLMVAACVLSSIAASVLYIILRFPSLDLGARFMSGMSLIAAVTIAGIIAAQFAASFGFAVSSPQLVDKLRDLEDYLESEKVRHDADREVARLGREKMRQELNDQTDQRAAQYAAKRVNGTTPKVNAPQK